ncbi:hypothetical protein UT300012_23160 [Paraclostridium bifermentans]
MTKKFTGNFKNRLLRKEETNSTPESLVDEFNKDRDFSDDFIEEEIPTGETLVGKPTGGRKGKIIKDVEEVVYDELASDTEETDYLADFDFEEMAKLQREKEREAEEEAEKERVRKAEKEAEELRRIEDAKRKKEKRDKEEREAQARARKEEKPKNKRKALYEINKESREPNVITSKINLGDDMDNYSKGKMVRTMKPILTGNKQEIVVGTLDIKPIKIGEIKDEMGYISERIKEMEDKLGISVLPFTVTRTLPQVVELAEHKIIEINGMKYSSGTTRIVNQNKLDIYIENIRRHIERGREFDDTLLERVEIDNQVMDTLKFNTIELEMLNTLFLEVSAVFYTDESGDMRLNVGGYNV